MKTHLIDLSEMGPQSGDAGIENLAQVDFFAKKLAGLHAAQAAKTGNEITPIRIGAEFILRQDYCGIPSKGNVSSALFDSRNLRVFCDIQNTGCGVNVVSELCEIQFEMVHVVEREAAKKYRAALAKLEAGK